MQTELIHQKPPKDKPVTRKRRPVTVKTEAKKTPVVKANPTVDLKPAESMIISSSDED